MGHANLENRYNRLALDADLRFSGLKILGLIGHLIACLIEGNRK